MSNYPESVDIFTDKTGADNIASSDPNNAFDGIEATQGLIGACGKPQSWSETLMNALRYYRRGLTVQYSDADAKLYVLAGEATLVDTNGNKTVFRRNSARVELSSANLDVGTLAATFYYVYGRANGVATTCPIVFSTDAVAPFGVNIGTQPFIKLGWFKNEGVGGLAVTFAGSWRELGDSPNAVITPVYAATYALIGAQGLSTIPDTFVDFISSGRPVFISGNLPFSVNASGGWKVQAKLSIDGTDDDKSLASIRSYAGSETVGTNTTLSPRTLGVYAAGAHRVYIKWSNMGDNAYCGTERSIIVQEL